MVVWLHVLKALGRVALVCTTSSGAKMQVKSQLTVVAVLVEGRLAAAPVLADQDGSIVPEFELAKQRWCLLSCQNV